MWRHLFPPTAVLAFLPPGIVSISRNCQNFRNAKEKPPQRVKYEKTIEFYPHFINIFIQKLLLIEVSRLWSGWPHGAASDMDRGLLPVPPVAAEAGRKSLPSEDQSGAGGKVSTVKGGQRCFYAKLLCIGRNSHSLNVQHSLRLTGKKWSRFWTHFVFLLKQCKVNFKRSLESISEKVRQILKRGLNSSCINITRYIGES